MWYARYFVIFIDIGFVDYLYGYTLGHQNSIFIRIRHEIVIICT